ncbi:hypothetical protein [Endozoicomonas sp.]|uniref:hypothetical protein n=1 Tax=Endozoicomonas sp. TaxID=1892382 RepID=UPI00383A6EF2
MEVILARGKGKSFLMASVSLTSLNLLRLSKPVMPDETVPVVVRRKKKTFVVQGGKAESITAQGKPEPEKSKPAAVKAEKAKPVEQKAEPAKEKPGKKKPTKSQKANRKKLERLISRWPDLFCDPPKPLAIGIYDDLLAQLDPEEGVLTEAWRVLLFQG